MAANQNKSPFPIYSHHVSYNLPYSQPPLINNSPVDGNCLKISNPYNIDRTSEADTSKDFCGYSSASNVMPHMFQSEYYRPTAVALPQNPCPSNMIKDELTIRQEEFIIRCMYPKREPPKVVDYPRRQHVRSSYHKQSRSRSPHGKSKKSDRDRYSHRNSGRSDRFERGQHSPEARGDRYKGYDRYQRSRRSSSSCESSGKSKSQNSGSSTRALISRRWSSSSQENSCSPCESNSDKSPDLRQCSSPCKN